MFAYNPTVNDNSGQITAGYQTKSAEIKAAGNEALAQGITDGVMSIAGGIGGAIAKSQANTAKLQGIQATGSAMQAILPQYGEEGMALGQALQSELGKAGTNPDKMAGAMMAFMPAMENLQSRYNESARIEGYKDLSDYKSANTPAAAPTQPKLDANYGRQFYQGLRQQGKMTHEQALAEMDKAGMNWAKPFIEGQKNPFFQ
jgi:hypothetical protein